LIAVTGASGHLGQWVVARLTAAGHDVMGLARRPIERPSIAGLRWLRPVTPIACDLTDAASVDAASGALRRARALVHLAAHLPADTAAASHPEALATLDTNVRGTIRLLRALDGADVLERVVLASSFEVYGEPVSTPIREDHATRPLGFYAASKLAAEKYLALFGSSGVSTISLRFSTVYGPGDTLQRAVGNFVRAAAAGRPIELHGDGSDLRDLVYVEDAADAVVRAVDSRDDGVINVGSGRGDSIEAIATAACSAVPDAVPILRHERVKPRRDIVLDVARAREVLGWQPTTSLAAGVEAQLEWVRATNPRSDAGTSP